MVAEPNPIMEAREDFDICMEVGGTEAFAQWAIDYGEQVLDALASLTTRVALAEAGLPGLIFSKRKALVECCAQIAETCELFNGDRLKNSDPRVTIAATIRELGLSRARSDSTETEAPAE